MAKEARRKSLSEQAAALRQRSGHLGPQEIAGLAVDTGASVAEALHEISIQSGHRSMRSGDLPDSLARFVSSLCSRDASGRILEYTSTPYLLTASLPPSAQDRVSVVSRDKSFAEALRVLIPDRNQSVFETPEGIPPGVTFSAVVCSPAFGFRQPDTLADGFGGEAVMRLAPYLSEEGMILWVTARGVLFNSQAARTFSELQAQGLHAVASIETVPGMFPATMVEGAVIVLRHQPPMRRFVATLRDAEAAVSTAAAFLAGPTKNEGPNWAWLDRDEGHNFSDLEQSRLLKQLIPRGRHTILPLSALLHDGMIERADRPLTEPKAFAAFLYVPEYAGSRVTAELEEQTVKPKAVYRLAIDAQKANPRFLAQLLNSPYGKQLRSQIASGATIQRISPARLRDLQLPIPDLATQDRVARVDSDIRLLQSSFRDMQEILAQNWTQLPDISEKLDALKAVLDIERQIASWWRELPYPLATIYRRYQVSAEPKERLDTILHFFEMAAVYLATIGASHVKALRPDWQEVIAKWIHPAGAAGIERADFGFWINLARASLKDTSRIASDKDLRAAAVEIAGPELVQIASTLGPMGKATEVLDVARRYRNSWRGHGGYMKPTDAVRLDEELHQPIRDFYEITASIFRHFQLVRPGMAEVMDTGLKFQMEILSGSDPTFAKEQVELATRAKSNALAFWMRGARTVCRTLPFFRLGAPQQPQETSFYVFNRVENGGFRWISYQEAREQEFIAPDDELFSIIALGKESE